MLVLLLIAKAHCGVLTSGDGRGEARRQQEQRARGQGPPPGTPGQTRSAQKTLLQTKIRVVVVVVFGVRESGWNRATRQSGSKRLWEGRGG